MRIFGREYVRGFLIDNERNIRGVRWVENSTKGFAKLFNNSGDIMARYIYSGPYAYYVVMLKTRQGKHMSIKSQEWSYWGPVFLMAPEDFIERSLPKNQIANLWNNIKLTHIEGGSSLSTPYSAYILQANVRSSKPDIEKGIKPTVWVEEKGERFPRKR